MQKKRKKIFLLETLFHLTKLENTDLKVNIYNLQGDFLADVFISGEMEQRKLSSFI